MAKDARVAPKCAAPQSHVTIPGTFKRIHLAGSRSRRTWESSMHLRIRSLWFVIILIVICAIPGIGQTLPSDNPFAQESTLPYHMPPFDRIKDAHFRPPLAAGMPDER